VRAIAPSQANYRILVVEDNPTNRLLLMRMLSLYGFELREAVNGQEAIAIWQDWQPHLIFMDMRMPVMTGLEATRQIKSTPQGKNTVIIALTASAFDRQQQTFFTVGCDDLIRKPFQHQELVEKLTQHLGIQYHYAEETLAPALDSVTTDTEMLQSLHQAFQNCLVSLPAEWTTQLQQAALEGNDARILELLQHLAPDQVIVKNGITQLAEDFQFSYILDLF
jgi:two-component system, sensor histidine kinase and response regulator